MGILDIFSNTPKQQEPREPQTVDDLYIELTGKKKEVVINKDNALEIPMVNSCLNLISSKIATLPIKLYKSKDGVVEEIFDDNRLTLLNRDTGDTIGAYELKENLITDYLLSGKSFCYIQKDNTTVKALRYIDNKEVQTFSDYNPIYKEVSYSVRGVEFKPWELITLLNSKDGYTTTGILQTNQEVLKTAWYMLQINKVNSKNGNVPKGVLESDKQVNEGVLASIKDGWKKLFSSQEETDSCIILNAGIKYKAISTSSKDAQLLELSQDLDKKICSILGVPYDLIGCGNIGHEKVFNKTTIVPLLKKLELAINKSLLLETEKEEGYFFSFDLTELLKDDIETRYKAYQIGIQKGFLQINEVRQIEKLPPIEGLEGYVKLNLADVLYNPETKELFTPNTNKTLSLTGESVEEVKI
ncbi:phage portal protein [Clostridium perfringens]|uniref:phage portal protein n=1 Tax=Clostridium perfringens TaxID=1502 RepID=UPI0028E0F34B|nr:phage portal protein [Clostridium perfringens]MDT9333101.1 phage portal protein [Clostridium perfringens]